jgi:hypothetical protein
MKKLILAAAVALLTVATAKSQEIFEKGTNVVNLGIGVSSSYTPIEFGLEHSILDGLINGENGAIGVGGYVSYYRHSYGSWGRYDYFTFGVKGAFHYQFVDNLDTYAGLMLGYNYSRWVSSGGYSWSSSYGSGPTALGYSLFVGARYYFAPSFGVYAEAGYGIANLSAGIVLKF